MRQNIFNTFVVVSMLCIMIFSGPPEPKKAANSPDLKTHLMPLRDKWATAYEDTWATRTTYNCFALRKAMQDMLQRIEVIEKGDPNELNPKWPEK